ncbi:LysR substrate-binding domain-containing protein [Sinorhizobium meliloti]|uniref:LysR substrate-binding domain-containing protein n=1 Tax=Rhizobium meliloti TaxID=382 RepID=UPI003F13F70F
MRKLPPLNALKVFEACTRHESFTSASHDLLITQSAVSRHIKNLEDWFGYPLFHRNLKHLKLTSQGHVLASELQRIFDRLESVKDLVDRGGNKLRLKVPPSFASRWLMPRLHSFAPTNLGEFLELGIGPENVDFRRQPFGAAIVCSTAVHDLTVFGKDIVVGEVLNERMTPVISPALYRASDINDPTDLAKLPLLHPLSNFDYWGSWFDVYGIAANRREEHFYDLMETAIQGALHGLGVAIINPEFVGEEIRSGRLIFPFPDMAPVISSYQFIYPQSKANHPGVTRFREWLRKNADLALQNPAPNGFGRRISIEGADIPQRKPMLTSQSQQISTEA